MRLSVAMSLDGYIADSSGGSDWILMDPDIDFSAQHLPPSFFSLSVHQSPIVRCKLN